MNALDVTVGETLKFYFRWVYGSGVPVVDMTTASAELRIEGVGSVPADGADAQAGEWTFVVPPSITGVLDPQQRGVPFQVWVQEAEGGKSCALPDGSLTVHEALPVSGASVP